MDNRKETKINVLNICIVQFQLTECKDESLNVTNIFLSVLTV